MRREEGPGAGDTGPRGSLVFVFHSHTPYCRKAGMWPFGEEWLYEVMLESYIPLLELLRTISGRVAASGPTPRPPAAGGSPASVTVGITPILLDQLDDDYMREGFLKWAEARLARAEDDRGRFRLAGDDTRERQAAEYCERYGRAIRAFRTDYARDIAGALGELQARGVVEIITSAATHAYLPLLKEDTSIRAQLATGCESYARRFGRAPRGIWLPECAYRPGLEDYLQALGLEYFFVDRHAIEGGEPIGIASGRRHAKSEGTPGGEASAAGPGAGSVAAKARGGVPQRTTFKPYLVGRSKVACFGRNERVTTQVWSSWLGYPGDGLYREFHKKDDVSGLQYWRVTSRDTDLGAKGLYDGGAASSRLREHAAHFVGLVHELIADWWAETREHGVIVAPYDTELFGHWWYEGIEWLGEVLKGISESAEVTARSAGKVLADHPAKEAVEVPESSWGRGGKHDVWFNDGTAWMWEMIHAAEARVKKLAALCEPGRLGLPGPPGHPLSQPGRGGQSGPSEPSGQGGVPPEAIEGGGGGVEAGIGTKAGVAAGTAWDVAGGMATGADRGAASGGEAGGRSCCAGLLEEIKTQALREFFLLMSSDWPFLVTERQATEYGARRFREHAERFDKLMDYAERLCEGAGMSEEAREEARRYLAAVNRLDDPFPWLDFSVLSAK
ncbi:MAG: 1,4-alpha-glucan branching protein domain-containing protein [Clostridia bacterium]